MYIIGLDSVTDLRRGIPGTTLQWRTPANAPAECISKYRIDVGGTFSHTTTDNGTSINLTDIGRSVVSCGQYLVTVTPVVPLIGLINSSTSEEYALAQGR